MSVFPTSAAGVLAGLLLSSTLATGALAQSGGWVDPPARSRTPPAAPDKAKGAEPAAPTAQGPAAASPASPPAVVVAPDASTARPDAPTRQADAPASPPASRSAEAPASAKAAPAPRPTASVARTRTLRAARAQAPAAARGTPFAGDMTPYAAASRRLALDYLAAMAGPGPAVAATGRFYGPRVAFHGRQTDRAALLAEKRRFVARWPERSYRPYLTDLTVTCNAALGACIVRTPFAFDAQSPNRGALSRGTGMLVLGLRFEDGRPVIASEASRVLSREHLARVAPSRQDMDDDDDAE